MKGFQWLCGNVSLSERIKPEKLDAVKFLIHARYARTVFELIHKFTTNEYAYEENIWSNYTFVFSFSFQQLASCPKALINRFSNVNLYLPLSNKSTTLDFSDFVKTFETHSQHFIKAFLNWFWLILLAFQLLVYDVRLRNFIAIKFCECEVVYRRDLSWGSILFVLHNIIISKNS